MHQPWRNLIKVSRICDINHSIILEEEIRKTKEKDLEDFLSEEKNKNPITKPRLISVDPIIPKPVIPAQIRMRVPVSKK